MKLLDDIKGAKESLDKGMKWLAIALCVGVGALVAIAIELLVICCKI